MSYPLKYALIISLHHRVLEKETQIDTDRHTDIQRKRQRQTDVEYNPRSIIDFFGSAIRYQSIVVEKRENGTFTTVYTTVGDCKETQRYREEDNETSTDPKRIKESSLLNLTIGMKC